VEAYVLMLPGNRNWQSLVAASMVAPGRGNEPGDEPGAPAVVEPSRKSVCKWPGKWGRRAEVVPTAREGAEGGDVEMDGALWGELSRYIDVEKVVAQLPLHAFYRARSVCKKWNSLPWNRPFLEEYSTTWLPKPYFILHGNQGCHQALLVKDVMLEKWILKPLPAFAFQHNSTSVAHGVVYTCTKEGAGSSSVMRGTVFNMHTKVFRRLPPLPLDGGDSAWWLSTLAVDKHSGLYKVLVVDGRGQVSVYDSVTGVWTRRAASPAKFFLCEDSAHCEGVMYIKWRAEYLRDVIRPGLAPNFRPAQQGFGPPPPAHLEPKMLAYNFKDDSWSVLRITPPALPGTEEDGKFMFGRGLGEWRGALRDVTFDPSDHTLRVWELEQSRQEWLEVDRMPANMLAWFLDRLGNGRFDFGRTKFIRTSYCEHYVLMWSPGFSGTSGLSRLVLYDMALKSWDTLNVGKDWICSCPFGG
jgi:hypothetical protein